MLALKRYDNFRDEESLNKADIPTKDQIGEEEPEEEQKEVEADENSCEHEEYTGVKQAPEGISKPKESNDKDSNVEEVLNKEKDSTDMIEQSKSFASAAETQVEEKADIEVVDAKKIVNEVDITKKTEPVDIKRVEDADNVAENSNTKKEERPKENSNQEKKKEVINKADTHIGCWGDEEIRKRIIITTKGWELRGTG